MEKRTIYFLFTDTGTNLSRIINIYTKQSLNHVSIAFDLALTEVYSFGRTKHKNPFSGGFVREDIRSDFLKKSNCAVYSYDLTPVEVEQVLKKIKNIEENKDRYRYNFVGLIGILFQIEIKREKAFFCSEFVATILNDTDSITLSKPNYFMTPSDIQREISMELIYEGKLSEYIFMAEDNHKEVLHKPETLSKQSFIHLLSKKMKRFVMR